MVPGKTVRDLPATRRRAPDRLAWDSKSVTLRAALIGCGNIAHFHADALEHAGVPLVAVCDSDEQKAAELAARVPGAAAFTDADALLADARPDCVHILTPPATHAFLTVKAAEAGAHVLVEKPVALSTREVDEMIAAARSHGVRLVPHHNYLLKPAVRRARELVEADEVGEVVLVETYYGLSNEGSSYGGGGGHWAFHLPGGVFTNFLPHTIYLQAAFLGSIDGVTGVATAAAGGSAEPSELSVLVRGAAATGVMAISMRAQPYTKYVRVFGTKGIIHADLVTEVTTVNRLRRLPRLLTKALFNLEVVPQLAIGTMVNGVKVATGAMPNMPDMHAFIRELYSSLEAGREPPAREEDGRMVVSVMEEIWRKMPESKPPRPRKPPARAATTSVERQIEEGGGISGAALVTGAAGYLGRHVTTALFRCGAEVRALVRDPSRLPPEVEAVAHISVGNLVEPGTLASAMSGVELVVHCAAVTRNKVAWRLHQQSNIDGTRAVLAAARAAGVRRFVHVSTVIVYGDHGSTRRPLDESAPAPQDVNPWAFYLRSKLAAERLVMECAGDEMEVVVVRPGIIYGPDTPPTSGLPQLGSTQLLLGRGRNHLPYTYVGNVVDGILLALTVPEAAGQIYNLVDQQTADVRTVTLRAAELAGEPVRLLPLPVMPFTILAAFLERRHDRNGHDNPPPISRFHVNSATRDLRYDTSKAQRELGWMPAVGLEEGLRRALSDPT
jgi:predicted dehydrogenase/nucleoside-diphosphate-sugar epimerase